MLSIYIYKYIHITVDISVGVPMISPTPTMNNAILLLSQRRLWADRLIVWPSASPGRPRWVDNNSERRPAGQPGNGEVFLAME